MACGGRPELSICIGLDEGDPLGQLEQALVAALAPAGKVHLARFDPGKQALHRKRLGGTPLCWMWNELAAEAQRVFQPAWTLLLGDDLVVEPAGWPAMLAGMPPHQPGSLSMTFAGTCLASTALSGDPGKVHAVSGSAWTFHAPCRARGSQSSAAVRSPHGQCRPRLSLLPCHPCQPPGAVWSDAAG